MLGVLGGGIGGLSAAYYALKLKSFPVKLFESSTRVGGWIRSTPSSVGSVFEVGPRTLRPKGEVGINTLMLIDELGLSNKVMPITHNHPAALNRLVYVNKSLYTLPSNLYSLMFTKPPFTKPIISALLQDMRTPKKKVEDESIYSFVERRLGKEIAEFAISPLICGVCAGNAKEISVKFLMKSLFEAEQNHGTIMRGMLMGLFAGRQSKKQKMTNPLVVKSKKEKWSVYSLEGGLETLPKALLKQIKTFGGDVNLDSSCKKLTFVDDKVVIAMNNKEYEVDHVISSLPARKLAPLLHQHPYLSEELQAIPTVTVAVINLNFAGNVLEKEAFGFLVPPSERVPVLGIVFDSCCFPSGQNTVLTVMMGGYWFEELFGEKPTSDELLDIALKHTKSILNITQDPQSYKVSILKNCIPQYVLGHYERVERIRKYIKSHKLNLVLCGSSYDGVGVNDVIFSSMKAVDGLPGAK